MTSSARSSSSSTSRPVDQAHGLRQMFPSRVVRFIPVVSNPQIMFGGVVLERLCAAFAGFGLKTLVVDAGERARPPSELAGFDLSEGIEHLTDDVHYMPARGLPLRHVDAQGSSASLVNALADAAPQMDVILVHASASELVRVMGARSAGHNVRPLVFTDEHAAGLTHAYAAIKTFVQRARWMSYDLLVCAGPGSPAGAQIAQRLGQCSDNFLGAAQRDWLQMNPMEPAAQDPSAAFLDMAADLLRCALPHSLGESAFDHLVSPGAALPSRATPVFN